MRRAIITYAEGAHEELLDVALPGYKVFAQRHGYDLILGEKKPTVPARPPAWNKVPLLIEALESNRYDEVVWFDADLVVVDLRDDFPKMPTGVPPYYVHSLVRHFAWDSEVPNTGVWRLQGSEALSMLYMMDSLRVFTNHGWWEQAALMTLMGYTVPPEGSDFRDTKCRRVQETEWSRSCQFMRLAWNSHPNYRADRPRIVHCSYVDMQQRLEVMRALARDPTYDYPRYNVREETEQEEDES